MMRYSYAFCYDNIYEQISKNSHPPSFFRLLLITLIASSAIYFSYQYIHTNGDTNTALKNAIKTDLSVVKLDTPIEYNQQIKPLLERRCVVCHGCFDAPCQLKLSSAEGLKRGANSEPVYNPKRITSIEPTRLFIDAKRTSQWRDLGFQSILNEKEPATPFDNLSHSVLYQLLLLKQQHPQPQLEKLPDSFTLQLDRKQSCPTQATIHDFVKEHPQWGMPYALPNLTEKEYQTLVSWIAQGSPTPDPLIPSATVVPYIKQWETFLNQAENKPQLMSRYLYEHLYHAHIHFLNTPKREFYRLIRSTTPPGQPIDEIATVRPYDSPGSSPFYYRLLRYQPSIVIKNHLVYEFSAKRMQRYRELFLEPEYTVNQLPSYQPKIASNPFKTFIKLPLKSRYKFLLDDSRFFIQGFVKGPVCRGQIALDVIEDQFWVLFFDPEQDVFTNDAEFIGSIANDLQLPADRESSFNLVSIWTDYWKKQQRYLATKQVLFEKITTHDIKHAMNYIWDGDGNNPNAALTVFRHFDSGSVAYGLVGSNPETTWVIDYPLFERIHYLLVAGFNVYGNVVHQVNTRVYMDFLRMEGEDHFLAFLPTKQRKIIRDSWYSGIRSNVKKYFKTHEEWLKVESVTGFQTDDPQQELYQYIKQRLSHLTHQSDLINRCGKSCTGNRQDQPLKNIHSTNSVDTVNKAMEKIAQMKGEKLHALADVSFVRITSEKSEHHSGQNLAYSLIRNKAYKNVTSFLADERERNRADIKKDTMTVVNWLEGSYPNFFFSVDIDEVETFTKRCAAIRNHADYEKFVDRYGIRRTHPDFWKVADWFQRQIEKEKPVSSGVFDFNRYLN